MYVRWNTTKMLTEKNITQTEFAQWVVKELDEIYGEDTGLIIRDTKTIKGGIIETGDPTIWFPPEDLTDVFVRGFFEYKNQYWWKGPQNPKGFLAIMLVAIHEYAHCLFFKWNMGEKNCKVHGRQFIDICRQIYRNVNFNKMFQEWENSKVVYI